MDITIAETEGIDEDSPWFEKILDISREDPAEKNRQRGYGPRRTINLDYRDISASKSLATEVEELNKLGAVGGLGISHHIKKDTKAKGKPTGAKGGNETRLTEEKSAENNNITEQASEGDFK